MRIFNGFDEIKSAVGTEVGVSDWIEVTQESHQPVRGSDLRRAMDPCRSGARQARVYPAAPTIGARPCFSLGPYADVHSFGDGP